METLENHRIKLKEISDYAFGYGEETVGKDLSGSVSDWDEAFVKKYYNACHEGFKFAQILLIEEIKKYQTLLRETKSKLKELRRKKSKDKSKETEAKIKVIEHRLRNFSHIADGIAWQLISGQIHIARRLYIQEKSTKFLDSSNIKHTLEVVNDINQNPNNFALISDLTSFIQIGDLLVKNERGINIVELKEGKVNEQIEDFLHIASNDESILVEEELNDKFDENTIRQINRMIRQKKRGISVTNIINNDKGIDPVSGRDITIVTPKYPTKYYHNELVKLHDDLQEKFWAYTLIESCLHVGMYRDEGLLMAQFLIRELLKSETENYVIVNWITITKNISEPLFAKPFPSDFIVDILTEKIKVIIGINVDKLLEIFNDNGLKARWLTEKETAKRKQEGSTEILVVNKKGITVTLQSGQEILVLGGIFSKIVYDNIKPSSIALAMQSMDSLYPPVESL